MNISTGHGASLGRTLKGIMSVFLPLLHLSLSLSLSLISVFSGHICALKIEDGKESMKEEGRGEEEGRGLPAQGAPTTAMCPGLCQPLLIP